MSRSKRRRRASEAPSTLVGCALTAAIAVGTALVCALIFAAVAVRGDDPAKSAPLCGLAALALGAFAAGIAAARLARIPTLVCAAVGAGIAAAAMLLSLVPALPEVALPAPKLLLAAIPVVCAVAGAAAGAPKRRRRAK